MSTAAASMVGFWVCRWGLPLHPFSSDNDAAAIDANKKYPIAQGTRLNALQLSKASCHVGSGALRRHQSRPPHSRHGVAVQWRSH
ncbi:hypothetical protein PSPO01_03539 [Paraphaeosphaeria sporulosa]